MLPRERVLAALSHQKPDRTPADFWAEPPAWKRLLDYTGHDAPEKLLRQLQVDLRHLEVPGPPEISLPGGICQNFWGERYLYRPTDWGPMREDLPGALAGARCAEDLDRFPWPSPDGFDYSRLAADCDRHENYALLYGFADIWQRPGLVRGWENWFSDLVEHPDWVHALCSRFTRFYQEDYTRAAEASGGRIDLYLVISDLGHQAGPLISPRMFQEFVAPYLRSLCDTIHGLGARVLFHSCGNIGAFLPALEKLGVDLLDPIQPLSPALQPEALHAEFGGRLAFHGGVDMQRLLPFGSAEEVRSTVAGYCRVLGESGGYILAPGHLFQPEVPPENVLAFYDPDLR